PRRSSTRPIPPPHLEVPALPAPVFRTLSNGLIAAALPMPGESAHMRVRLKAGAAHDPKGREGTALLTARLLTAGSAPGPAETLADRQVRLVSSALQSGEAFANREFIEISATLFPDAIADASRVLARAITEPVFDDAALARTKRGLAAVKTTRSNNSRWRADRGAFEALYAADQRYGRPPEGTAESLAAISREDVTAFHRVHYRPERVVVVVAGAIDPVAALTEIERAFGTWRPAAAPPTAPAAITAGTRGAPAAGAQPTRVHIPLDKVQASLTVALPGISRDSDDFAALSALNYLLGETGYAGRLGEVLVDTGISYSVYATFWADRGAGPVLITTDAVRSREAADLIVRTLDSFARNGVTEAELREAKGYLLGRLLFRFESPQAATATLAEVGYFAERTPASAEASGLSALRAFARRVLALTVDNLNRAARKYYDPSRAAIVIAGR
ncbi:MAG TPA: pitrilysin family protein, partial [Vicinamibacterales bacterium]|nr:pitrilysin family protein [Vicinamibacterales bacterium]